MKHIPTTLAQAHLATVLLAAISLGAYGCADTATVNPVVELAGLTVTPGTLQPTFKSSTTQYSVDLTSDIATVTITAQPAVSGDSVTINGLATTSSTISLGPEGSTTSVSIVVSESGNNSRTYTVLVTRAGPGGNNSLQNLTVSPGTLIQTFDANRLLYDVSVANSVESVTVTPTLQDLNATMTVNGQAATSGDPRTIALNDPGKNTDVEIRVTAQSGAEKPYTIRVSRGISNNANLQSLTISPGTLDPPFSTGTSGGYSVNVASSVGSVVVIPTLQDTTATMTVNGTPTTSGQARSITLSGPGSHTFINVNVTAQSGSQNNYVVVVIRTALGDNNLSALTVSPGSLIPSFAPNTTDYTVNVATNVSSVDVSATKAVLNAVMTGDVTAGAGNPTGNAPISLNGPGTPTNITISVTAPNGGTPKTYTITVNRAASSDDTLSELTVTANAVVQPLVPDFNANILTYTVNVATTVDQVTVAATKSDLNAVMLIGSVTVPAGTPSEQETFPLNGPGTQTVLSIAVTAQSGGAPKTYSITVNRAASSDDTLSELTVTANAVVQPLVPDFNANILTYTVNVATTVDQVTVAATKSDLNAVMLIGSVTVPAGTPSEQETFPLNGPGTQTVLSIAVTAQSGGAPKTYTIAIDRDLGP